MNVRSIQDMLREVLVQRTRPLPPRILSRIFENSMTPSDRFHPLALSHVCRYWRVISTTTPVLWSNICLDLLPLPEGQPALLYIIQERLEHWLTHSGHTQNLNITVNIRRTLHPNEQAFLIGVLLKTWRRCLTFDMYAHRPELLGPIIAAFPPYLTVIRQLRIECPNHEYPVGSNTEPMRLRMPNVTSMALVGPCRRLSSIYAPNLQILTINISHPSSKTPTAFQPYSFYGPRKPRVDIGQTLSQYPTLRELDVTLSSATEDAFIQGLHMPWLIILRITSISHIRIREFISKISAPSLETLAIKVDSAHPKDDDTLQMNPTMEGDMLINTLHWFMDANRPVIRNLTFINTGASETLLASILGRTLHLTHLIVQNEEHVSDRFLDTLLPGVIHHDVSAGTKRKGSPSLREEIHLRTLCPRLQTLDVKGCNVYGEAIIRLILKRSASWRLGDCPRARGVPGVYTIEHVLKPLVSVVHGLPDYGVWTETGVLQRGEERVSSTEARQIRRLTEAIRVEYEARMGRLVETLT